ncbi:uncharacterized protein J3R85_000032 [Psidium guajava]|nr:uncharacterized protein J3R85_000032 [Psidium guajava]
MSAPSLVVCREVKHFKKWKPLLVPCFILANTVVFVITMYVNNCSQNSVSCVAKCLGRFSSQPFKENPLLGPSSSMRQLSRDSPFPSKTTDVPKLGHHPPPFLHLHSCPALLSIGC